MAQQLTISALPDIPLVGAGADLSAILVNGLQAAGIRLQTGDVLVVAQKIVSKAEGRQVLLADVTPSPEALRWAAICEKDPRLVELILQESSEVLRARPGVLVVAHRLGFVAANAGIDASNVQGVDDVVLLLPKAPDTSAAQLQAALQARFGVSVGVIINDSHGRAWRNGTVGTAIGVAGVPALLDLRGAPDLFGRPLHITQVGLADELAAAASILMGQAAERVPVVHIRGLPYSLRDSNASELYRPKALDMFR